MTKSLCAILVGVPFSSNIGDGVITDCLEFELRRLNPGIKIIYLDIAGRTQLGERVVRNRTGKLRRLAQMPRVLRLLVISVALTRLMRRLRPSWIESLSAADVVLVSGGQLFSDVDLNFPVKIAAFARATRQAGRPLAIVAAGASRNWSHAGRRLFGALADCDLRHVGLRDPASISAWTAQFEGGPPPYLARDPGLLAAEAYGFAAAGADAGQPIGLCVTAPLILAHHANTPITGAGSLGAPDALLAFKRDLALTLVGRGHRVRLFCNGADEDIEFMQALLREPALADALETGMLEAATPPTSGAALAGLIAGCRAVIAHRLHTCIVAYALKRPAIGLSWDQKLGAFFRSVSLDDGMITDADAAPAMVADRLEAVCRRGVDAADHDRVLAECRAGVAVALRSCVPETNGNG
jgi:polysaccharide pyruvyl transferase WcaK-like protein